MKSLFILFLAFGTTHCHFSSFNSMKNISEEFVQRNPLLTIQCAGFKISEIPITYNSSMKDNFSNILDNNFLANSNFRLI